MFIVLRVRYQKSIIDVSTEVLYWHDTELFSWHSNCTFHDRFSVLYLNMCKKVFPDYMNRLRWYNLYRFIQVHFDLNYSYYLCTCMRACCSDSFDMLTSSLQTCFWHFTQPNETVSKKNKKIKAGGSQLVSLSGPATLLL